MTSPTDCYPANSSVPAHEGTSQEQRFPPELDPAHAPVNEHTPAHNMVFAQAYATFLNYYGADNTVEGNWEPFFGRDVSVQLAITAIQDIDGYRMATRSSLEFLKNADNKPKFQQLRKHLGYLFSYTATLAQQFDTLQDSLPADSKLKRILQHLILNRLAPAFKRLASFYKADLLATEKPPHPLIADSHPDVNILGDKTVEFTTVYDRGLSNIWIVGESPDWKAYTNSIEKDASVFGSGTTIFARTEHIASHNLFTSILEQFLQAYSRAVLEAQQELAKTFTNKNDHEPHYALFLAFLRLFEHARAEINTLTNRHLDFYYREILRLKEKPSEPPQVHLLVALAKHVESHELKSGVRFKAGKDGQGNNVFFANNQDFVANQARVATLKTIYRHRDNNGEEKLYASPVSHSDDGQGAALTAIDQSWHPFFQQEEDNGAPPQIKMPEAQTGFAIASHHLWMAEGERTITVKFDISGGDNHIFHNFRNRIRCLLSSEEGWIEKSIRVSEDPEDQANTFSIELTGGDPPITPYVAKTHGYGFETDFPVLLVKLEYNLPAPSLHSVFQDMTVKNITLNTSVTRLKSLTAANDFGSLDISQPFQPYGALPKQNSSLIIGAKEAFQKKLTGASIQINWKTEPQPFDEKEVGISIECLQAGAWKASGISNHSVNDSSLSLSQSLDKLSIDKPDFSKAKNYDITARHGFLRLSLNDDFDQDEYKQKLIEYIKNPDLPPSEMEKSSSPSTTITSSVLSSPPTAPVAPVAPVIQEITLNYSATQTITLDTSEETAFSNRQARFFHVYPFGHAEQHPRLNPDPLQPIYLLPQFKFETGNDTKTSEAEFYIGIEKLQPPQNLTLLFQVADGTANPLSEKPEQHIHWSYLSNNNWISFARNAVDDRTSGLLNSGIIVFNIPRDASSANSILPADMHWLRAAVASNSDAVCRLRMVAAQALAATFTDNDNDPAFPATTLPAGTIGKLKQPVAAVKNITQPFETFGGRGKETAVAFHTRISERLRHKDRTVMSWDYEHLILEAFPQIYKAKCLNHTHYGFDESGTAIYRELAPGHVTVIAIPGQQFRNQSNPLQPYTSLGLLDAITAFLRQRLPGFVKLHVKNPRFETVRTTFKVRLHDGFDEKFYIRNLQEAITRFLSPWAFSSGGGPGFSGKIHKSVLINFAEEQPYVDYVTDFKLFHDISSEYPGTDDKDMVEGSLAVSILVSAPASQHIINTIKPTETQATHENRPCEI